MREINARMKVKIVESLCIACGLCREVCPERAVHPKMQDIHHMYEVIENECTGCADCLPYRSRVRLSICARYTRALDLFPQRELRYSRPRRETCKGDVATDESTGASLYICHTRVRLRTLDR